MMGIKVTMAFSEKIYEKLNSLANEMGVTKTVIASMAINDYYAKIKGKEEEERAEQ